MDYSNNSNYKIDKKNQIKSWAFERFLSILTSIKVYQRDLSMKQRQTPIENRLWLPKGGGVRERWIGIWGSADESYCI